MGFARGKLTRWPRCERLMRVARQCALAAIGGMTFFACAHPARAAGAADNADREIASLAAQIDRLEASRAVKHLQRAYGFYMDRALWRETADLFAPDATLEIGADGVYVV